MSLSVLNMLGGGGANAPYAWAKYEHTSITPVVTLTQVAVDNYYYYLNMSSDEIDVSTITKADLVGLQTTRVASDSVDTYWTFGESNVVKTIKGSTSTSSYFYTVSGGQIVISLGGIGGNTIGEWSSISLAIIESYNFIEYITDKSPTKYPNGEVHTDGYFYRYAPEGLYAWKKCKYTPAQTITNPQFRLKYTAYSKTIELSEANFDLSVFEDITKLVGFSKDGVYDKFNKTSSGNIELYVNSSYQMSIYSFDKDTNTISCSTIGVNIDAVLTQSELMIDEVIGDPIDYVVSDKENAYPDGAVHTDGYYYEKVGGGIDISKLGCTKFEEGSFTPSSNIYAYNATHSLGIIPKFAIVYGGIISGSYINWETFPITTDGGSIGVCVNAGGTGYNSSSYRATFTSSKAELQVNTGHTFKTGIEYHYLLLA